MFWSCSLRRLPLLSHVAFDGLPCFCLLASRWLAMFCSCCVQWLPYVSHVAFNGSMAYPVCVMLPCDGLPCSGHVAFDGYRFCLRLPSVAYPVCVMLPSIVFPCSGHGALGGNRFCLGLPAAAYPVCVMLPSMAYHARVCHVAFAGCACLRWLSLPAHRTRLCPS